MPTYDYQCKDCGYKFEKFQPITAPTLRKCPKCGKKKLQRLLGTGAGVIFKGNGFYQTDYRSKSYKKGQEREKAYSNKNSKKSKGKSESKSSDSKPGTESKSSSKTKSDKQSA